MIYLTKKKTVKLPAESVNLSKLPSSLHCINLNFDKFDLFVLSEKYILGIFCSSRLYLLQCDPFAA